MPDPMAPVVQRTAILRQLAPGAPLGDAPVPALEDTTATVAETPARKGTSTWAKALYGAGAGADIGSTIYGLNHGMREANPLINFAGDRAAIPIGMAESLGTYLLTKKLLGDKHPKIMNAILGGAGIMHGAAAAHNLMLPQTPSAPVSHDVMVYDTGHGGFVPPK